MNDRVECFACIHHLDDLSDETFKRRCDVVENHCDSFFALDRQTVSRYEQLGALSDHSSQCLCPFERVTLNFLRVAGVGVVPNYEVASEQPLFIGQPCPQVVVCFTASVMQFDFG